MADKKISEEINGAPAQGSDEVRIRRGSNNFKLALNAILALFKADTDIADAVAKKHAHSNITALNAVTGVNTGDQNLSPYIKKWTELVINTDYSPTPASISSITMNTDKTAVLKSGMALKYTAGGVDYFGICDSIVSAVLHINGITLAGKTLTNLYYSTNPAQTELIAFVVTGKFADAANTQLLQSDAETFVKWYKPDAKIVKVSHRVKTDDSGANQPRVNITVGGPDYEDLAPVCTSNSSAGRDISEVWVETVVDIDPNNYSLNYGDLIEVETDDYGSNDDAENLTVQIIVVYIN